MGETDTAMEYDTVHIFMHLLVPGSRDPRCLLITRAGASI
jgi:hypothetical protein